MFDILLFEEKIKKEFIKSALKAKEIGALSFEILPSFILEVPKEKKHGNYSINLAMILNKIEKKNPKKIAEILIKNFCDKERKYINNLKIEKPGFINIFLNENFYKDIIENIIYKKEKYGNSNYGKNKKVNIEFVSANPTGLLHVGNARGAVMGDVLSNILKTLGFEVFKEYYVNDSGNQIENFGASLEARYLELLGEKIDFPENGYYGEDIIKTVKNFIKKEGEKLISVSKEERIKKLIKYGLNEKLNFIKKELDRFGIKYDLWFFEKTLYENNDIEKIINILKHRGYIEEKEDAIWLKTTKLGEKKDEVMIRQNGIPTYFAADIAYHKNKFDRGFEYLINIWGADHHGHVARLKKAILALGYNDNNLKIILMQLVRLFKDGEVLKVSKRTGNYITLEEVLNEVGVDVSRYFFIMRNQDSHLDFDLDLAKKESLDNPVYYIQYAYARISSILNQIDIKKYIKEKDFVSITEIEKSLVIKIGELQKILIDCAIKKEPYRIASYAYEISSLFHNFYNKCNILKKKELIKTSRIKLIISIKYTLKKILLILGISAPEKM